MRYLSVCSGIEAATVAWHNLGWVPAAFSEIEPFPSAVLKHHYPDVPNVGDMTKYREWNFGTNGLDLLVGGTPCQSFSVAGLRKGLDDPRGNLALVYCGILDHFRPKWCVWENVPGVLSSSGGRDFGSFLGALAQLGYGFAYRVLDAQYFGVAQRRRRVFVVGHLGDWRPAAEVLFEPESLRGDLKKSRKTRQGVTGYVESSFGQYRQDSIGGTTKASGGVLGGGSETFLVEAIGFENSRRDGVRLYGDVTNTLQAFAGTGGGNTPCVAIHNQATRFNGSNNGKGNGLGIGKIGDPCPTLTRADVHAVAYSIQSGSKRKDRPNGGFYVEESDKARTLDAANGLNPVCNQGGIAVAFAQNTRDEVRLVGGDGQIVGALAAQPGMKQTTYLAQAIAFNGRQDPVNGFVTGALDTDPSTQCVAQAMAVRRLTPIECERLQGFPDNYTNIPWRKSNESPDGPRYKALGNSMAVPVMRWIGARIKAWEARQ